MAEELKRYVVVTDFYLYAKDDQDALAKARTHAVKQSKQLDDRCSVNELYEMPYGSIHRRKIKIS